MLQYYRNKKVPLFEIKRCCTASQSKHLHFHTEVSIALIAGGSTTVTYNKKSYTFTEKDLLLIPPHLVHNCIPDDSAVWEFSMVMIDSEWFHKFFQYSSDEILQLPLSDNDVELFNSLLISLEQEPAEKKEDILLEFSETILEFLDKNANKVVLNSANSAKAESVKSYIDEHFRDKILLDELAEIAGVNRFYLTRCFKKRFNITPLLYQRNIRFNYAKEELRKNVSLVDLALDLGYYDQSHFTNDFTAFTGISPGEYMKL